MQKETKIAIIGGGAGGILAAIAAAEEAQALGLSVSVHIYEATDKIGRPILASGNGRCNFSNSRINASAYRNSEFAAECLNNANSLFDSNDGVHHFPNGVVAWFSSHGLMYAEEAEGRLYPRANKSSSVLDVLRLALDRLNVQIHLDSKVESIDEPRGSSEQLTMRLSDGSFERADKIIIASGGAVTQHLLPDNLLSFKEPMPVLCPLEVDGEGKKIVRKLENIRVKCVLFLLRNGGLIAQERGEAMFRKYGISGICAFNLSRFFQKGDTLRMNLFPNMEPTELQSLLGNRATMLESTYGYMPTYSEFMCGMTLPRIADAVIERAGFSQGDAFEIDAISKLAYALQHFDFILDGPADIEHAQVQRGGFCVEDIDPATMQVKNMTHLYVIGEALDVDGPCGGYNLTWAFATGLLAGKASVQDI